MGSTAGQDGLLGALLGCCCGAAGMGEELYKDWESHPACQHYTMAKRLGEGGFSEVHLAHDKLTGKAVALKVVFLNKGSLTKGQRRILAGEARLVRMVAHPHIVRCMQVLETRRQQVLVLEHLSGGEMLRQLQRMKRYTEASACQIFKQVVDAVAYLHSLGILHRDIKPENCLLAKPAGHYASKNKPVKVKLIDLGMAGLYRPNKPVHGCMGSPGFIAPEVILGEPHTPAMDVYSLGVLLFVMLVGRKPWDAQRSHTLAYAVQHMSEAPGLHDPVFLGLSAPAQQLLVWMLAEDPNRRPTAQQVLGHSWVLQGGMCKVEGASSSAAAAAVGPSRVYQQVVQQRLQVLSHSRDIMGSARGLMVLHGSGSRSQAVRFHRAVKAARLQLQTQAAALLAAGQVPPAAAAAAGGLQSATLPPQQATAAAAGTAGAVGPVLTGTSGTSPAGSVAAASAAAVSSSSGSSVVSAGVAALARSSAPPCAASAASMHASSSSSMAAAADRSRALPRPASTASLAGTATEDAAAGEPAASRRQRSVTVGQLARQDLTRRHSLLFGALQQQQLQQPQRRPPQQAQQQQQGPRRGSMPGRNADSTGNKGRHRHTASAGGAWFGGSASSNTAAAAAGPGAASAAAAGAAAQPISIDLHQLALVDELERGMSAPNAEAALFSLPVGGAGRPSVRQLRQERAVSTSPGVLALLDADDQMCLLHAIGASVEDEDDGLTLLGGGVLSWGRRGAADMVASFRQNYPMRPIARSFALFSQSLSRSLSRSARSGRSPGSLKVSASGCYLDAAAAAAATEAHVSAQDSVTEPPIAAAAASPPAAVASVTSPAAAAGAAAMPADEDVGLSRISFFVIPDSSEAPAAVQLAAAAAAVSCSTPAAVQHQPSPAATQTAAAVAPRVSSDFLLAAGPSRLASTLFSEEGSLDMQHAFLGAQMSLDSSLAASFLAAGALDARSPTASLPHASPLSAAAAAAAAAPAAAAAGQPEWMPLRAPAAAASAVLLARISVGQHALGFPADISRVSTSSAGSSSARQSAFASSAGAAAATAAAVPAADAVLQGSGGGPVAAAAAAVAAQRGAGSDSGPFTAVLQSPSVRAAATAAAARAEEEGIGLPNGLWLQQSLSIKSTTVSSILQLLSPRKGPQAAADAAAAAAATAGGADTGQLGSAGDSIELVKAGSSRSLSAGLQPLSPSRQADAASSATSPAAAVSPPLASIASDDAPAAARVRARGSSPVMHTRDISFIDYLPDAVQPAAAAAPGPAATADATAAALLLEEQGASPGLSVSSTGPSTTLPAGAKGAAAAAAAGGAGITGDSTGAAGAAATAAAGGQSTAVNVPQAVVTAGRGRRHHSSRAAQLWLSSPAGGHRRSSSSSSSSSSGVGAGAADGGALPTGTLPSAAEGPIGLGVQCSGGPAHGQRTLEHAPSAASSVLDREFDVGSFWSPTALAGQLSSRQQLPGQQQQQRGLLGRSASSLGRLDSLDLTVGSPVADAGLGFGGGGGAAAAVSPLQAGGVGAARVVVRRTSSSSAAGGQESKRASVDGTEGLLEGFLPADCTGDDAWGGNAAGVQQDGAAVLVWVHSGRVFGAEGAHSGAAVKAVNMFSSSSRQQPYSSEVSTPASTGLGYTAATGPGEAAAAAASRVGKYGWIAKAVVSRSSHVQQPQQQPQFDSFDEPNGGEWYFAGP